MSKLSTSLVFQHRIPRTTAVCLPSSFFRWNRLCSIVGCTKMLTTLLSSPLNVADYRAGSLHIKGAYSVQNVIQPRNHQRVCIQATQTIFYNASSWLFKKETINGVLESLITLRAWRVRASAAVYMQPSPSAYILAGQRRSLRCLALQFLQLKSQYFLRRRAWCDAVVIETLPC